MAFIAQNMSALAYANGFTLWTYKSTDTMNAIAAAGYLNPAASMVSAGDLVMLNAADGGRILRINKVGGTVTTAALA